ncbi:hypothetical protein HII36_23155 [Nonomuraea sp. NN258]|nr:hypothetical protein [Nonomuraea antri]NRQ34708.1 hypothetical protein [Nonomuraea antri]
MPDETVQPQPGQEKGAPLAEKEVQAFLGRYAAGDDVPQTESPSPA